MPFTRSINQINNYSKATQDSQERIKSSSIHHNGFRCPTPSWQQCSKQVAQDLAENLVEQKHTAAANSEPEIYSSTHEIERDSLTTKRDVIGVFESTAHISRSMVSERKKALQRKFSKGDTSSSLGKLCYLNVMQVVNSHLPSPLLLTVQDSHRL